MSGQPLSEPLHGHSMSTNWVTTGSGSVLGDCSCPEEANVSEIDSTGEDDTETLLHEVGINDDGNASNIKALTDADAEIIMYLPLRNFGSEEPKFSSVFHGTAAAGLECAGGSAFFSHA